MHKSSGTASEWRGEHGFTLIEALIAMVILMFGIAGIANLMVIAGSSNAVANSTTSTSAVAAQQMELLKSAPFNTLVPGGTVVLPPVHGVGHPDCNTGFVQAVYACDFSVLGMGAIHVQWAITGPLPAAAPAQTLFVDLVAEPVARSLGQRSNAHFTSFRTDNN